jgi:WD40 repeat protein
MQPSRPTARASAPSTRARRGSSSVRPTYPPTSWLLYSRRSFAVGNSLGRLLVIGKDRDSKGAEAPEFDLLETLREHTDPICCVESAPGGSLVASADTSGTILVRNPDDNFELVHRIAGNGFPVSALVFLPDKQLVSGDITGKLRIYNPQSFHVTAEVSAHSRAITALASRGQLVVSVSEDTFMNVWELNQESSKAAATRIKLESSQQVSNDLLVGVAFASESGKNILTVAYDTSHLKLWVPE